MHELGIIINVAREIDKVAAENDIQTVSRVTLEIGEVTGVITEYFIDCWNYFKKKHPVLRDAELVIETIPAVTYCENCQSTYSTVKYGKICPHCGSGNTWLLRGNEMIIKEIAVPDT